MNNRFEIGKTYETRSACDHNCIFEATVIKKTEKTVTVETTAAELAAVTNASGKILSSVALQLKYAQLTGQREIKIPMLEKEDEE